MRDGSPLTHLALKRAGIPFMTTFAEARVSAEPKESHLKAVDAESGGEVVGVSEGVKQRFMAKQKELTDSGMLVDAIDYDHKGNWIGLLLQKNLNFPEQSDQISFSERVNY